MSTRWAWASAPTGRAIPSRRWSRAGWSTGWAPATARAAWRCSSGSPRRSRAAAARPKGELDLHLRGRRGESRARRHGVPAQERPGAARRADPGRADREQPDRGRARRDVGQDHDQGQGGACRQPVGRRQRHPAHDAAGGRAAGALRQGAAQARQGRHEVDGERRHVPWRPQHQRRALGLHGRDRPPPAARREGEGRLQGAEGAWSTASASPRACTRSSS